MNELPVWYWVATAACLGACLGSFLHVVSWRVPRGESVVFPPSRCPCCGRTLPWYRNLPIVSWTLQRGRCAWCGWPIPARYVLFELGCAALGGLWAWDLLREGSPWSDRGLAGGWILFAALALPISRIDWERFEIPDGLVATALAGGLFLRVGWGSAPAPLELVWALRDGLLGAGGFYALSFVSRVGLVWAGRGARSLLRRPPRLRRGWVRPVLRLLLRWARFDEEIEGLGLGDVSLALAAGVCLGAAPLLPGAFLAALFALPASPLRARWPGDLEAAERLGLHPTSIPFGPFLCLGFLLSARLLVGLDPAVMPAFPLR